MADTEYQLDILVQGYPGKSVCHGGLGWSTIVLLRGHGRVVWSTAAPSATAPT